MDMKCSFKAGSIIGGKFEVIRRVGEGSLGDDIYLGTQQDLKRQVMIHILPREVSSDREMVQRFVQEIQLTAALQHPNIIPAYEAGEHLGRAYLITAAADGENLKKFVAAHGGKLGEKEALQIAIPIAEALDYAWAKLKVLHRNICPESIIVTPGPQPLVSDFGMAKTLSESGPELTMAGVTIGNPQYMSPEQVRGQSDLDCRSDLYCLGLLLYEMLAGHPAVEGSNQVAMMESQINGKPSPLRTENPAASAGIAAVVEKTLQKKRDARYQDWGSLVADLKSIMNGENPSVISQPAVQPPAAAQSAPRKEAPPAPAKRGAKSNNKADNSWLLLAGVLVGALLLIGALALFMNADEKRRAEQELAWEKASVTAREAIKKPEDAAAIAKAVSELEALKNSYPNSKYSRLAESEIARLKALQGAKK